MSPFLIDVLSEHKLRSTGKREIKEVDFEMVCQQW